MDYQQIRALCDIEESVCRLAELYCAEKPAENDISDWFTGVDFEALPPEVSCMAAALASKNNYIGVPAALIPRLRGISKYVHTLNSGMIAGLYTLGKQFNQNGISAVLLGSAAVHLACPTPPQRHLWQVQIGVSESDFTRAVELTKSAGFVVEQTPYTAIARRGNTQCIHIRKEQNVKEFLMLTTSGISFLIPSNTQLLISLANTLFQMLTEHKVGAKLIPWIMDLHSTAASITDWETVADICTQQRISHRVQFMLELYDVLTRNAQYRSVSAFFGDEENTHRLTQLLCKLQKCHRNHSKFKRLWLHLQIENEISTVQTAKALILTVGKAAIRKIAPKRCNPNQQNEASSHNR